MGCSTSVYSQYPNLKRYRQLFELIELSDSSVRKLYDVFTKTDSDNSGKLNIVEFLTMLNMERTTFSNLVFNCMDKDGSGQIEFKEWIVSIWSFTSLDRNSLISFTFNLYDQNKNGILELHDVLQLLKDVYGASYGAHQPCMTLMNELSKKLIGVSVNIKEFYKLVNTHQILLFPAFSLQKQLRKCVVGEKFWEYYEKLRLQNSNGGFYTFDEYIAIQRVNYGIPPDDVKPVSLARRVTKVLTPVNRNGHKPGQRHDDTGTTKMPSRAKRLSQIILDKVKNRSQNDSSHGTHNSHNSHTKTDANVRKEGFARRMSRMVLPQKKVVAKG